MPDLLTTKEAAERCKVGPRAFTTWARKVGVVPVTFGRRQRWRWSDVQAGIARAVAVSSGPKGRVVPIRKPRKGRGDSGSRIEAVRDRARRGSTP